MPVLRASVKYDRAVGFFSAGMLSYAAQGLSTFIENDGHMRLIIGGELEPGDAAAIEEGYEKRELAKKLGEWFLATISQVDDLLFYRRLEALSWLVASGRLEIKIALKRRGMYHEKIGILTDAAGDSVVFQGSANETAYALLPDFNFESINVFPTWIQELKSHFTPYISGFERLWTNQTKNTLVLDFPEAAKEKLIKIAKQASMPRPEVEIDLWKRHIAPSFGESEQPVSEPTIPQLLNGRQFNIMDHQRDALQSWKANDLQGIFALATGAGKTITAIYGAVRIFEQTRRLFLVIAVPYQNLADQWVDVLHLFNIHAVRCYDSARQWTQTLSNLLSFYQSGHIRFACVVVVNRTLQTPLFQSMLTQVPGQHLVWVGDECHHHATSRLISCLPAQAKIRMGLSATPEHYMDQDVTNRLIDYYGSVVARYGLEEALRDDVLTPYDYKVVIVDLTDEEAEEYRSLSEQISHLAARSGTKDIETTEDDQLKTLLFRRARLLGAAANKLIALREILRHFRPSSHTLFYCGDGRTEEEDSDEPVRQVEAVSSLLYNMSWKSSRFTARESRAERENILNNFRLGFIDALVAIRCLDEGIDVPACRTAFILASGRNPKQFIQRRGRILRKSPGKEAALIFDFLVRIPEHFANGSIYERQLIRGEIARVAEFARLSGNAGEPVRTLMPLLEKYDLVHALV